MTLFKKYKSRKKGRAKSARDTSLLAKLRAREGLIFNAALTALAFIISAAGALTGGYNSEGFDLKPGTISNRRIQAPYDIVNENATNTQRLAAAERARAVVAYKLDDDVTAATIDKLYAFFGEVDEMRRLANPIPDPTRETQEPVAVADMDRSWLSLDMSIYSHFNFLMTSPSEVYVSFRDFLCEITESRMTAGIREDMLYGILLAVRDEIAMRDEWDSVVKNAGYSIISQVMKPNIFIDTASMELSAQAAMDAVEPVIIRKGQNIVLAGGLITREIYDILEGLGMVRGSLFERIPPTVGALLCIAAVFIVGLLFLATAYKRMLAEKKNVALLFTLYTLTVVIAWLLQGMSFVFVPILLFTMLTAVLLDEGLAVGFCLCVSVVCAVMFAGDLRFLAFFVITGLFMSITAKLITERSMMLSVTALMSGFCFLTVCAVYLVSDRVITKEMWDTAVIAALYGMFSVVLCVGILPFFETAFGFLTTIKLVDLANPNNPLLRRLLIETPGTYQHSLVVANLAETACYAIGANHTLARVGSYYHDCGKLGYPNYFIENISGGAANPHDTMDPMISVRIISEHVTNGLALADTYKLPKPIRAFIEEHHGGSLQKYFCHKAKENAEKEGGTVNEEDFRYKQRIPQSREVAVVMLADTVEAAVRSVMPDKMTMDELPDYINTLIRAPLTEGRLRDSGLVIKDLTTIAEAFCRVFKGMFHERVAYPTAEEPSAEPEAEAPAKPVKKPVVKAPKTRNP